MKRKLIITIACAVTALLGNAQAFYADYTYDAAGNRITMSIVYMNASANTPLKSAIDTSGTKDGNYQANASDSTATEGGWDMPGEIKVAGRKVKLYPNPTHGLLKLEIIDAGDSDINENGKNSMEIKDLTGRTVLASREIDASTLVDISQQPAGTYIMEVKLGAENLVYKIIKVQN